MRLLITLATILGISAQARAQNAAPWAKLDAVPARTLAGMPWIRPERSQALVLNVSALAQLLASAPQEAAFPTVRFSPIVIPLPMPDGNFERFAFVESSVMAPELAARYPAIRTYLGQGLDTPAATVRFDLTPQGFHAQVLRPSKPDEPGHSAYYIDPITRGDTVHYASYWRSDLGGRAVPPCATTGQPGRPVNPGSPTDDNIVWRYEYRLAVAASGEYTAFVSAPAAPNVTAGMASIVTAINRVNQIYERDLNSRLILVPFNDLLVYTDASSDPFSGTDRTTLMGQAFVTIDTTIGTNNYDLGHLFYGVSTGGKASINGVCINIEKARAVSGSATPTGDLYWVDMVSHEMGHQLGATHTFNGTQGSCTPDQYSGQTAYEPGSGTTIMSYAGTCSGDDLAPQSDPMFGLWSIAQAAGNATRSCGTGIPTGNHYPSVVLGNTSYIMPCRTSFQLSAVPNDPDSNDALTSSWEEQDLGPPHAASTDSGQNEPLVRVRPPSTDSERLIPSLPWSLAQGWGIGDELPLFNRDDSRWCVVIRDNVAGGGGTYLSPPVHIHFVPSTGFKITSPGATALCAGHVSAVQWDTAGTNGPPVNCDTVDILMSFDGGQTWPYTLAGGVPNSGQALFTVPGVPTLQGRIMVHAGNNLFFSLNPGPIYISTGPPTVVQSPVNTDTCPGQNTSLTVVPGGGQPRYFQWRKNGSPMGDDNRVTGTSTATLSFSPAGDSDTADYDCVIFNGCGSVTSSAAHLQVGPDILQQPADAHPQPCDTVTFSILARGVGTLRYLWYRNGVPLVDDDRITGSQTSTLTIHGVTYDTDDKTTYRCRVWDSCTLLDSSFAVLTLPIPTWHTASVPNIPCPQGGANVWTSAYDERRGVTVMYGGYDYRGDGSNWLVEYDGVSWTVIQDGWSFPANTSTGQPLYDNLWPPGPAEVAMTYNPDDQKIYFVWEASWNYPMRIVTWDGQHWGIAYDGPVMGGSNGYKAAYDRARHRLVIMRDSTTTTGGHYQLDTMEFDPATGTLTGPTSITDWPNYFPPSYGAGLIYDDFRSRVLHFQTPSAWNGSLIHVDDDGAWSQLPGTFSPFLDGTACYAYDSFGHQTNMIGRYYGDAFIDWTGTTAFPVNNQYSQTVPAASDYGIVLPDGPPRNPAAAGISPDNNWVVRALVFDRRRRSFVAPGYFYNAPSGPWTWQTYERRYLDRIMFDRDLSDTTAACGSSISLQVYAAGAGSLTFQWRRNGTPISDGINAAGTTITGAHTSTLTFTNLHSSDSASYDCLVTNGCGSVPSTATSLSVCYANCDCSTVPPRLNSNDFQCFLNKFAIGDPYANCDGSQVPPVLNANDFQCFLNAFAVGCP